MNDPGLEDNIENAFSSATQKIHHNDDDTNNSKITEPKAESNDITEIRERTQIIGVPPGEPAEFPDEEDEGSKLDYYQPTWWWLASTAFPLIAGTFGPIANLFSICALVQTWRVTVPNGEPVADPPWLLALNIICLILALAANLVLLFNFSRRIPYKLAQVLTITLWYLSCIFLIIPLILTHTTLLNPYPNYALSQSYYYALIATIIYFLISTLLLINILGAYIHHAYPPSFNSLTKPQRTLMLQTIAFSCYLSLGAGVFSTIEGWEFVDGLYWADYTLLTVGFGTDFPLKRTTARILLMPYAAIGITSVGLIISSVRGFILERGKARISKRRLGKEREKWESYLDGHYEHLGKRWFSRGKQKARSIVEEFTDERHGARKWGRREFELMRYVEESANRSEEYIALVFSVIVFALVWAGGAVVFWACQRDDGWTYTESLYFGYVAILTIGYGDFYPSTNSSRPFFVIWSLVAVPAMTVLISTMGETVIKWIEEATVWLGQRSILPERRERLTLGTTKEEDKEKDKESRPSTHSQNITGGDTKRVPEVISQPQPTPLIIRLSREITQLAKDASKSPPPQYDWDNWVKWLKMMDEIGESLGNQNALVDGSNDRHWRWTWLDDEGPLFSLETETQWVLDKLCLMMERLSERKDGS